MAVTIYQKLRETAHRTAGTLRKPTFYLMHDEAIRKANECLESNASIGRCRERLDESQLECAHGLFHCESVARDAGAVVLIEADAQHIDRASADSLFLCAVIAGLLHDIKRKERDHAFRGGMEAEKILADMGMSLLERQRVADAIRNHEAFQETFDRGDREGRLVSDALYDADKFRWGPENFTTTLWLMVEARGTPPEVLHRAFREKMQGIEKIKETFRTETGRKYGPEFIDQGIAIGNAVYEELSMLLDK
jgi:hypothetical protein